MGWMPQIETRRRGDDLVVHADLPGLRKEDVHVEVDDGILTISGERSHEHEDERDDYYRSERSYGQFYRAIPLPEGVDENACEATFKDGVLEVSIPLPKQQEKKAKEVQIR
jgi:HSP20 family protein